MSVSQPAIGSVDHHLADAVTLFTELNDLKRIVSAGRIGSVATRLFHDAWAALADGTPIAAVAECITGRALAAARLGDLDRSVMAEAGLTVSEVHGILMEAAEAVAGPMLAPIRDRIARGLAVVLPASGSCPAFVDLLAHQPRAGITCPGKPRIILEPPENHADHCLVVAVYGMLLAPGYAADGDRVFLAALAHHFHNAGMPDSGFTGEVLLGPHLDAVIKHFTTACLEQLAPALRNEVEAARAILPDDATEEGRAFHAADVLDRVLQLNQYARAAALTPERMLGEMELVHAGPVKAFQDDVLRQAGLL